MNNVLHTSFFFFFIRLYQNSLFLFICWTLHETTKLVSCKIILHYYFSQELLLPKYKLWVLSSPSVLCLVQGRCAIMVSELGLSHSSACPWLASAPDLAPHISIPAALVHSQNSTAGYAFFDFDLLLFFDWKWTVLPCFCSHKTILQLSSQAISSQFFSYLSTLHSCKEELCSRSSEEKL